MELKLIITQDEWSSLLELASRSPHPFSSEVAALQGRIHQHMGLLASVTSITIEDKKE